MNFSKSSSQSLLWKSQSRYLGHTIFCISEQGITEIINRYIINEVGATSIFGVCEITFFHQLTNRLFQDLFSRGTSVDK